MMYEVVISDPAERDLYGIFEYIAFHLQSVENATGQVGRFEAQIASLDRMPECYRRYEREPWFSRGVRIVPVDNYCVFYIPAHVKKTVTILRVVYGGRDIDRVLAECEGQTN